MKSADVVQALLQRHEPPRWVAFAEMRLGTLTTPRGTDSQRADLWCMDMWPSSLERVVYEVKVSRADYIAEVRKPDKRRLAMLLSNRFCFATPAGMIKRDELPLDVGLVEVYDNGTTIEQVAAPWRDIGPPTVRFLAELARRALAPEQLVAAQTRARVRALEDTERRLKATIAQLTAQRDGLRSPAQTAVARAMAHVPDRPDPT